MKNFKITVITVSFNSAKTIEGTIKSVVSQFYKNIEYIIIDGASNDSTVSIIEKYKEKIRYISEPDQGIYDAMNKGVKMATGDYISFLGSDDIFVDEFVLDKVAEELNESVDILSAGIYMIDERFNIQKYVGNGAARDKRLYNGDMIPHPAMFVRSKLMRERLFDTKYKSAADFDFFLKCYLDNQIKFKFVDMPVVFFSLSGISSVNEIGIKEHLEIMKKMKMSALLIDDITIKQSDRCRKIIRVLLNKGGLLGVLLRFRGWKKHRCSWKFCRWCNLI